MELIKNSINSNLPDGTVRIKLSVVKSSDRYDNSQFVDIFSDGEIIWKGRSGETAELCFSKATAVKIRYCPSMINYGGECTGVIDPTNSKNYNVSAQQGIFSTLLVLHSADEFDLEQSK